MATYGGSVAFEGSTSASVTVIVAKATTKTTVKLSAAKITYGHEQSERVSVTVWSQFAGSVPTGTVTVRKSTTTLCTISLKAGKRSCTLASKKLKAGTYHLFAVYTPSSNFKGSTSPSMGVAVAK